MDAKRKNLAPGEVGQAPEVYGYFHSIHYGSGSGNL